MTLRQTLALNEPQARAVLGALRATLDVDGVRARGAELLRVVSASLELGDDWSRFEPTGPAEVAAAFSSDRHRRVIVDAMLIPACIEGAVSRETSRFVRSFASALGVESHWVALLEPIRRRSTLGVQRVLVRQSPDGRRVFSRLWREDRWRGVWLALRFVLGVYRDAELASRFRALGSLPKGTFGRAVADHVQEHKIAWPGERGGIIEKMIHHDLLHVLNHYGTDPIGECELAGFYAGFAKGDAFTFIVVVLTTFHLGMPVSPAIVTPAKGAFDPARVLAAFLRGRRVTEDLMGQWDYWSLFSQPIDHVRAKLGIELRAVGRSDRGEQQDIEGAAT